MAPRPLIPLIILGLAITLSACVAGPSGSGSSTKVEATSPSTPEPRWKQERAEWSKKTAKELGKPSKERVVRLTPKEMRRDAALNKKLKAFDKDIAANSVGPTGVANLKADLGQCWRVPAEIETTSDFADAARERFEKRVKEGMGGKKTKPDLIADFFLGAMVGKWLEDHVRKLPPTPDNKTVVEITRLSFYLAGIIQDCEPDVSQRIIAARNRGYDAVSVLVESFGIKSAAAKRTTKRMLSRMPLPSKSFDSTAANEFRTKIRALRRRITGCWDLPDQGSADMRVEIRLDMNPDGTVDHATILDPSGRSKRDEAYEAFAESALRAVKNPRCQPFDLPAEHFARWRTIILNFDVSDMF